MMAVVVNESVTGGWLEFLGGVTMPEGCKFDRALEYKSLDEGAARGVVDRKKTRRDISEETSNVEEDGGGGSGAGGTVTRRRHAAKRQTKSGKGAISSSVWDTVDVALASAGGALFNPYVSSKEVAEAAAAAKVVGATAERNFPAQQYRVGEGAGAGAQFPQRVVHPALDLANVGQLGAGTVAGVLRQHESHPVSPKEVVRFRIEGDSSGFGDEEILRLKNMVRKLLDISIDQVAYVRRKQSSGNQQPPLSLAETTKLQKQAHDLHKDGLIDDEELHAMTRQCRLRGAIRGRCVINVDIDEDGYALNTSSGYSADVEVESAAMDDGLDVGEDLKAGLLAVFRGLVDDVQVDWCRYEEVQAARCTVKCLGAVPIRGEFGLQAKAASEEASGK
jgi:hypothetical protein